MRSLRLASSLCAVLTLASGSSLPAADAPAERTPAQVVVVCTLHQLHEGNTAYSFSALTTLIEGLKPDVLAVELTPKDLATRREQPVKQEYQRSIFPLLDKHGYQAVPLEPPEPVYSELVQSMRTADRVVTEKSPEKAEAFGVYQDALYDFLSESWHSPLAVNSLQTDALFEVKHKFQNALYGPQEERGWEGWNEHFLARILDAARSQPGKRIAVVVGVEHGYWLRKRLRQEKELTLLESEAALR